MKNRKSTRHISFFAIALVSTFMGIGLLISQEIAANPYKDLLRDLQDHTPSCLLKWKVIREIPANDAKADQYTEYYNKQIEATTDLESKKRLQVEFARRLEETKTGQIIPMTITFSYEHGNKYRIDQSFDYPRGKVLYEYYSDDDGVIYGVNKTIRRVRLLSPDKTDILSEIARGIPGFGGAKYLSQISIIQSVKETAPGFVELSCGLEQSHNRLSILLNVADGQLEKLEVFNKQDELISDITVQQGTQDGQHAPQSVVYRSFKGKALSRKETWTLEAYRKVSDGAKLLPTKYTLESRYHVHDETGPVVRKFLSDEALNSGVE